MTKGRYRRIGEVRAERLDSARTWTSDQENSLSVGPGDWWVTSRGGTERGVAAGEFPRLYEHIEGNRFRQRGEVTARQVNESEVVETLEGRQLARPGDWIVDDGSSRWPVPDDHFQTSYEKMENARVGLLLVGGDELWSEVDALAQWGGEAGLVRILHAHDQESFGRPADRLRRFVIESFPNVDVCFVGPVSDDEPKEMVSAISQLCAEHPDVSWRFNVSGGTRLMFAGGLMAARSCDRLETVFWEQSTWFRLHDDGSTERLAEAAPRASERFRVEDLLRVTWADDERTVHVAAEWADPELVRAAEAAVQGESWRTQFEAAFNTVKAKRPSAGRGPAFERFVAAVLLQLGVEPDDVAVSVSLMDEGHAVQEVDVVVNSYGRLHVIDCKLLDQNAEQDRIGVQIREAVTTRNQLGDGAGQLIMLRPNSRFGEPVRSLASAYDVRIIDQEVLANRSLTDVLAQLVRSPGRPRQSGGEADNRSLALPQATPYRHLVSARIHFERSASSYMVYDHGKVLVVHCRFSGAVPRRAFDARVRVLFGLHMLSGEMSNSRRSATLVLKPMNVAVIEEALTALSTARW